MTVRITRRRNTHRTTLQVDGRLSCANVQELTREWAGLELPIVLDLSELRFADSRGIAVLLDLVAQGAELQGVSPFVEMLLQSHAEACYVPLWKQR